MAHVESAENARKRKELAEELSAAPHIRETERSLRLAEHVVSGRDRRRHRRAARAAAGRAARILEFAAFPPTSKQCNMVGRGLLVWTFFERPDPLAARRYFENGIRQLADDLPHVLAQLLVGMAEAEAALGRQAEARGLLFRAVGREVEVVRFKHARRIYGRSGLTEEGRAAHDLFTDVLSRASVLAYTLGEAEQVEVLHSQALMWAGESSAENPGLLALVERRWERLERQHRFFWWL